MGRGLVTPLSRLRAALASDENEPLREAARAVVEEADGTIMGITRARRVRSRICWTCVSKAENGFPVRDDCDRCDYFGAPPAPAAQAEALRAATSYNVAMVTSEGLEPVAEPSAPNLCEDGMPEIDGECKCEPPGSLADEPVVGDWPLVASPAERAAAMVFGACLLGAVAVAFLCWAAGCGGAT